MQSSRIRGSILASAFLLFGAVTSPTSAEPEPTPTPPILRTIRQLVDYVAAQPSSLIPAANGPTATILLPSTATAVTYSRKGVFACVAVPQDQPVQVMVQYPTPPLSPEGAAVQSVKAEALDGGGLVPGLVWPSLGTMGFSETPSIKGIISVQGKFTFTFRPAHHPGLYQVRLQHGSEILGLQFWVVDPQNPKNNPPVMQPTLVAGDPPPTP